MIFIKIIISIAILCITSYIGIEMSKSLKAREEILTDFITFLRLLLNEMIYMAIAYQYLLRISRQKTKLKVKRCNRCNST